MTDIAHGFLLGTGFLLGLAAVCLLLGALGTLLVLTWTRLRYTRPGWWLHRHWPTRTGR